MHLRVELIDSASRRPIKTWRFADQVEITWVALPSATSKSRTVRLATPCQFDAARRYLAPSGLWTKRGYDLGNTVQEVAATDGMEFRLGALGPEFRCYLVSEPLPEHSEDAMSTETFQVSMDMIPELLLSATTSSSNWTTNAWSAKSTT